MVPNRLGDCLVCNNSQAAKYKCPRCYIPYCSLACGKAHKESCSDKGPSTDGPASGAAGGQTTLVAKVGENEQKDTATSGPVAAAAAEDDDGDEDQDLDPFYESVLEDDSVSKLVQYRAVQEHLKTVFGILTDPKISGEWTREGRRAAALRKLTELRFGGMEANEVVEEFCGKVTEVMASAREKNKG